MLQLLARVMLSSALLLAARAQSVSYLAGTYTSSCTQVCGAMDLLCADSMVEKMNCASLASSHCGRSSMNSNTNVGCTVSGCYVNCEEGYYYSKASAYSSCNTGGTCLTSSSNLYKMCPCYAQTSTELEGWAKMGLFLAGAIVLTSVGLLVNTIMCKNRNGSGDHEELDTSASQYDIESSGQSGLLASLSAVFSRKSDDTISKKKKVKKVKKARFKSKIPLDEEMDETRDMAIK